MKQYYDLGIFHNMMDGIDLDDHIVASYYLKDRLEGEKFLDGLRGIDRHVGEDRGRD